MPKSPDISLAKSVKNVLTSSRWLGAALARAQVALHEGADTESVARILFDADACTLSRGREIAPQLKTRPFTEFLDARTRRGAAENPITKMFPAAITERQFLTDLDNLRGSRRTVDYKDDRFGGHTLVDFCLTEGDLSLPVNVKNAGTRFENSASLVGLDPNDCIPIPAYKAHDAVAKEPNLLYAVAIDYSLIGKIETHLVPAFTKDERAVWKLLNEYSGTRIRDAEDIFIYSMTGKHWDTFSKHVDLPAFRVISARKAIRILQQQPKRTPGIGLRAWGTGASAEVNVHISVACETKPWTEIAERIAKGGLKNIIEAVNRKRTEVVYDPEI